MGVKGWGGGVGTRHKCFGGETTRGENGLEVKRPGFAGTGYCVDSGSQT